MAGRFKPDLKWSEVTPESAYMNRRQLLAGAGVTAGAIAAGSFGAPASASIYDTDEELNTIEDITRHNNFYEFGTGKSDPFKHASAMNTDPWSIVIDGMVDKPGTYDLADVLKDKAIEERIYRLRCVEAWSMVIPWNGFELKDLLDQVGVQPSAQYVAFETLWRPEEMVGAPENDPFPVVPWPYREGLRLDEAMNPLTIMATGLYGQELPNQNGAPIRLVVPWKYGFKSIKSVVRITLTDRQPDISWNMVLPNEYRFFSNVNPEVDHPRWSQAEERRIGGGLFSKKIPTRMFNGYEEHVAHLYDGMDLVENF